MLEGDALGFVILLMGIGFLMVSVIKPGGFGWTIDEGCPDCGNGGGHYPNCPRVRKRKK